MYGLSAKFERELARGLAHSSKLYSVIGDDIEPAKISDPVARLAIATVREIAHDVGKAPGNSVVVYQRLKRKHDEGKIDADELEAADQLISAAYNMKQDTFLIEEIKPYLVRDRKQVVLAKAVDSLRRGSSLSDVADEMKRIDHIGEKETELGLTFSDEAFDMIANASDRVKLPTGIPALDALLGGGVERGHENVVLGRSNEGKSMFLSALTAVGLQQGLFVGYITLELPPPTIFCRVSAAILGIPISSINRSNVKSVQAQIKARENELGKFVVAQFPAKATTVTEIEEWIERVEEKYGQKMDLLVVDYADKLKSDKSEEEYQAMGTVYEKLRLLVHSRDMYFWTASQATRGKERKEGQLLGETDIADSQNKLRVADVFVSANRTADMSSYVYSVIKHRTHDCTGQSTPAIPHDIKRGRMFAVWEDIPEGWENYEQQDI